MPPFPDSERKRPRFFTAREVARLQVRSYTVFILFVYCFMLFLCCFCTVLCCFYAVFMLNMMILQGFPESFVLDGAGVDEGRLYRQLGNAVSPPVVAAVSTQAIPVQL